jgi:hypothetical protein
MLKVEFKRNVYENEMEFNGIDLPIHKIVITDVEASKLQTLFQKVNETQTSTKEEDEELFNIIWKDKKEFYQKQLGDFHFNEYTTLIAVDVMGFLGKQKMNSLNGVAKKYQDKQHKKKN